MGAKISDYLRSTLPDADVDDVLDKVDSEVDGLLEKVGLGELVKTIGMFLAVWWFVGVVADFVCFVVDDLEAALGLSSNNTVTDLLKDLHLL